MKRRLRDFFKKILKISQVVVEFFSAQAIIQVEGSLRSPDKRKGKGEIRHERSKGN